MVRSGLAFSVGGTAAARNVLVEVEAQGSPLGTANLAYHLKPYVAWSGCSMFHLCLEVRM